MLQRKAADLLEKAWLTLRCQLDTEQELKYYTDKWDQFLHKWKPLLSSLQQQEKKIHLLRQLDDLETLLSQGIPQGIHQELGKSSRLDPVSLQRYAGSEHCGLQLPEDVLMRQCSILVFDQGLRFGEGAKREKNTAKADQGWEWKGFDQYGGEQMGSFRRKLLYISVDEMVSFHPFGGHDQLKKFARAGPHLEGRETISSFLTALRLLRPDLDNVAPELQAAVIMDGFTVLSMVPTGH
ncbi:hypothetical protein Acr_29g0009290 [Actinidia rufa]|uniref:Uncharacterized protein n=1 Tax=Actinidia rufa TaxID=165716 RepID=A0A7J0HF69_9ERIC|nr:hypothetical protein Acr_29g0009290 [Actinidia rufa]